MAATAKLVVLFSVLLVFAFVLRAGVTVSADEGLQLAEESRSDAADSAPLKVEIGQLNSKIQLLEKHLDESNKNLKSKDDTISKMEKDVQEKIGIAASLQGKIEQLQKKGTSDAEEQAGRANARVMELQKQVDQLKKDIELQEKEKDALEARATEAEKKLQELDLGVKNLEKINQEQQVKIHKTERALQVAEEEMMKAKHEASTRIRELTEVHRAWLPPWLAEHLLQWQSFLVTKWNEHGNPVMEILIQKTKETKAQIEKWAAPHIEQIKTKWMPAVKEQVLMTVEYLEPHLQLFGNKALQAYESSKTAVKPHVIKVQDIADPYYQEVKKFSKPYVEQVATMAKPHVEKTRVALKPYTKKAIHAYRGFLESATTYHHQIQATVHEKMKDFELIKHLATKELVWFVASALLALPVLIMLRLCSALFFKRSNTAHHGHPHHHGRKKGKRSHSEK